MNNSGPRAVVPSWTNWSEAFREEEPLPARAGDTRAMDGESGPDTSWTEPLLEDNPGSKTVGDSGVVETGGKAGTSKQS
ncbi:hypothetical protein NliqN6_0529 [Naganishia liquefaciens]|uniref:Uncharacterized protein n=1 Tax=Naganishia liquefaciens TaxID=104408 RepID=A0A8H3TN61_9TREE|nr:hypothetical protein NliqN6_0529 [Naganishia liquefaciens]